MNYAPDLDGISASAAKQLMVGCTVPRDDGAFSLMYLPSWAGLVGMIGFEACRGFHITTSELVRARRAVTCNGRPSSGTQ